MLKNNKIVLTGAQIMVQPHDNNILHSSINKFLSLASSFTIKNCLPDLTTACTTEKGKLVQMPRGPCRGWVIFFPKRRSLLKICTIVFEDMIFDYTYKNLKFISAALLLMYDWKM